MKKSERPMTNVEFFLFIRDRLKEKGEIPETLALDYADAHTWEEEPITSYEFSVGNNLEYGDNEGIYLDLWLEIYDDDCIKGRRIDLGTCKTLDTNQKAIQDMGVLLANFVYEITEYVNSHLEDFEWTGYNVYPLDENGSRIGWDHSCGNIEKAEEVKDRLLKSYPAVEIRDNATRRAITYTNVKEAV